MHEKLIDTETEVAAVTEFYPPGGRQVAIPAGLKPADLAMLPAEEIDQLIRQGGAALGYAAMIQLAAGQGGTPAGTQFMAAKFLIERGGDSADTDLLNRGDAAIRRKLSRQGLAALIEKLEADVQDAEVVK